MLQGKVEDYTPGQCVQYTILGTVSHVVKIKSINGDLFTLRYEDGIANFTVNPIGDGEVRIERLRKRRGNK